MDDDKEIIDDLMKFEELWDYEIFRDILETVYLGSNKSRPNFDPVLMFKIIILEIFYNFNDNKISKWIKNPCFKCFLDYPEEYPVESTIWEFKEKLTENKIMDIIWQIHQKQLKSYGFGLNHD